MEGGSRFERPQYQVEAPQQRLRNEIRGEVAEILESTQDELAFEVGIKILEKLDIKDRIEDLQRYKDDPTIYQTWKQLGLFIVINRTSYIDWDDEASGFSLKKGEPILDIHLPPVTEEQRTLPQVTQSLKLIADYIVLHDLTPKYIMGVTFEKLARVSRRQGFSVLEPQIPEDIQRGVENVYRHFNEAGINEESMGRILLCYQDTNHFLDRYLVQSQ